MTQKEAQDGEGENQFGVQYVLSEYTSSSCLSTGRSVHMFREGTRPKQKAFTQFYTNGVAIITMHRSPKIF
jgi:hypothetical protein